MSFEPGTYKLTNFKAGVAMDLSGSDEESVIAFSPHGEPNQQWEFEEFDGGYSIKNVGFGKYLTFPDEPDDGKQIIATDGPRPWDVRVVYEGYEGEEQHGLRIFVPGTDKNLDLRDHGDPTDGNIVQLWEQTPGLNQVWLFEPV